VQPMSHQFSHWIIIRFKKGYCIYRYVCWMEPESSSTFQSVIIFLENGKSRKKDCHSSIYIYGEDQSLKIGN